MDKELYIPFDKSIVEKAVKIIGSQAELGRYLTKNNNIGKRVSYQLIWKLLNENKYINKHLKSTIHTLLIENE